jgi:hypothetical protein
LIPLKGVILQDFIFTEENILTPEDIKNVVKQGNILSGDENMQKVNMYTMESKVAYSLSDPECLDFISHYLEAPD